MFSIEKKKKEILNSDKIDFIISIIFFKQFIDLH